MSEVTNSKRPWVVFACMLLIQAGLTGVLMNCIGVLISAVRLDLGFRAGDISFYYMIRSIVGALLIGTTTNLFLKKNSKRVLLILETILIGSVAAMAFFNELWQWYADAVFAGVGFSCMLVIIPITLNNWFVKKRGLVLGMTMSASGIAGALFSPLVGKMIKALGWRSAVLIVSAIVFAMVVLPTLFLFAPTPESVGEKPYGWDPNASEEEVAEVHRNVPTSVFIMVLFAVLLPGSLVQFANQIPTFAQAVGYSIEVGAMLTSFVMIGNLSGKLIMGASSDKIGVYRSACLFLVLVVGSMLLFLTGQGSETTMLAASILYGALYAITVNVPSLIMLNLYGPADYKKKLSRFQSVNGMIGAFLSVVFPYIYDFTGSFNPIFVYGVCGCVISFLLFMKLEKYAKAEASK